MDFSASVFLAGAIRNEADFTDFQRAYVVDILFLKQTSRKEFLFFASSKITFHVLPARSILQFSLRAHSTIQYPWLTSIEERISFAMPRSIDRNENYLLSRLPVAIPCKTGLGHRFLSPFVESIFDTTVRSVQTRGVISANRCVARHSYIKDFLIIFLLNLLLITNSKLTKRNREKWKKVRIPWNSWQRVPTTTSMTDRQSRGVHDSRRISFVEKQQYRELTTYHGQPPLWKYCFNSGHEALRDGYYPGAASFRRPDARYTRAATSVGWSLIERR